MKKKGAATSTRVVIKTTCRILDDSYLLTINLDYNVTNGQTIHLHHDYDDCFWSNDEKVATFNSLKPEQQYFITEFMLKVEDYYFIGRSYGVIFQDSKIMVKVGLAYDIETCIPHLLCDIVTLFSSMFRTGIDLEYSFSMAAGTTTEYVEILQRCITEYIVICLSELYSSQLEDEYLSDCNYWYASA